MHYSKKVRILGTRGIPAQHGGFETFAEQFSCYLEKKGWNITVYCQKAGIGQIYEDTWNGIHRVNIPIPQDGAKGTIIFDWKAIQHASKKKDPILTLGYNTAIFCVLYRLKGIKNIINMDGIEWKRDKWSFLERIWLFLNEKAGKCLGNQLVADHPEIKKHLYSFISRNKISVIPYTADLIKTADEKLLKHFNLNPQKYSLLIARPEPENSIHEIVRAFSKKIRGIPLVILGNYEPKINEYHRKVINSASNEVKFVGAIYDKKIVQALRFYARFYIHGHTVGGTNPSLVEALSAGSPILAHKNRFNRWVAGKNALYFSSETDCEKQINKLIGNSELIAKMNAASFNQFKKYFTNEKVFNAYEILLMVSNKILARPLQCLIALSNPFKTVFSENELKAIAHGVGSFEKKMYAIGNKNEVLGFLYKNSKKMDFFQKRIQNKLNSCYYSTSIKNLRFLDQTIFLIKLLKKNNIYAIPLKESSAGEMIFNDYGVYPSTDIDILVHPTQIDKVKRLLKENGEYNQVEVFHEKDLLREHYRLIFRNKQLLVKVHWDLTKRYFNIPGNFWWEDIKPIQWNGIKTFELSLEKYILYNIFRLFDHCFYPLKLYILLCGIIHRNFNNIDWHKLINYAHAYNVEKLVIFTLRMIEDMFCPELSNVITQKKYFGYGVFIKLVGSGIQSGVRRKHQRMLFYTILLIEPKKIFSILIKRAFPKRGELRMRYNIHPKSFKMYIYYFLNPFLLLFGKSI